MRNLGTAILLALATHAAACSKDSPPPSEQDSRGQLSPAEAMFNTKCARCHGSNGNGNGFSASSLRPRPHNYTDPAWQASITDDEIKEIIIRGGINLGKSPAMPGNPTLRNRPELLDGLVKLIRSFSKRP